MKRVSQVLMIGAGLIALTASQADAQLPVWTDRAFLNVNGAVQSKSGTDLSATSTFQQYDEQGSATTTQAIETKGGTFDISGGARVWRNFGLGLGFSTISSTGQGTVSATLPHPLYYDRPRSATASITDLNQKQRAIHMMALFVLPIGERFDVAVSAGPTFFSLEQDTFVNPQMSEVGPPYGSVTLVSATKVTTTKNQVGFNVGADVTFRIMKYVGVGGFIRYAKTDVTFTPDGGVAVTVPVGGMTAGGGVRLRF